MIIPDAPVLLRPVKLNDSVAALQLVKFTVASPTVTVLGAGAALSNDRPSFRTNQGHRARPRLVEALTRVPALSRLALCLPVRRVGVPGKEHGRVHQRQYVTSRTTPWPEVAASYQLPE